MNTAEWRFLPRTDALRAMGLAGVGGVMVFSPWLAAQALGSVMVGLALVRAGAMWRGYWRRIPLNGVPLTFMSIEAMLERQALGEAALAAGLTDSVDVATHPIATPVSVSPKGATEGKGSVVAKRMTPLWGSVKEGRQEEKGTCSQEANDVASPFLSNVVLPWGERPTWGESVLYLGEGFRWTKADTRTLYELSEVPREDLQVPRWVNRVVDTFSTRAGLGRGQRTKGVALGSGGSTAKGEKAGKAGKAGNAGAGRSSPTMPLIGSPLLHGIGLRREGPIVRPLASLGGGTLIVGTTQSGKGVVLTTLVTQAILRGEPVIVMDPKASPRLRAAIRAACAFAGRPAPQEFHPAFPRQGVRLDPLGSWTRPTELATRITAMLEGEASVFKDFAWNAINVLIGGLLFVNEKPTLLRLRRLLENGMDGLLLACLKKDLNERGPIDWERRYEEADIAKENRLGTPIPEAQRLSTYWESVFENEKTGMGAATILPLLAVYRHDREHYAKITASLQPILAMLTTGSLAESLSPDPEADDPRPIVSLERLIEAGEVLYLGLDALPDARVASALGNLLLADLTAYTGKRYNQGVSGTTVGRVTLFVDETANVMNRPLIELLNKGMEAGVHVTAAMQTIADLTVALGSEAQARQVLGNFNNLIALRTKDRETQSFIVETFGRALVKTRTLTVSSSASTELLPQFSASVSRSEREARDELIPIEYLGQLPNGEFFASLSGARIYKGRMPIVSPRD